MLIINALLKKISTHAIRNVASPILQTKPCIQDISAKIGILQGSVLGPILFFLFRRGTHCKIDNVFSV